jgi:hypothetical protein
MDTVSAGNSFDAAKTINANILEIYQVKDLHLFSFRLNQSA